MEKADELRSEFGCNIYILGRRNGNTLIIHLEMDLVSLTITVLLLQYRKSLSIGHFQVSCC